MTKSGDATMHVLDAQPSVTPADHGAGGSDGASGAEDGGRGRRGGWLGLVAARIRDDRLLVAAAWLTILIATTAMTASAMRSDAVARSAIQQVLADAPPQDARILVAISAHAEDADATDATVREELRRALGPALGTTWAAATSDGYRVPGRGERELAVFGFADGLQEHARLLAGAWPSGEDPAAPTPADPSGPVEVAISSAAAAHLGLAVGDALLLEGRGVDGRQVPVVIGTVYEPLDPGDPWWSASPLLRDGLESAGGFTTLGPLMVERAVLVERLTDIWAAMRWQVLPDRTAIEPGNVAALAAGVRVLGQRLDTDIGRKGAADVTTELPAILARATSGTRSSGSGILLLDGQVIVLGGYALIMVAAMVVERRRGSTATLRTRGATTGQLLRLAATEAILLVLPAVVLAPILATALLLAGGALAPVGAVVVAPRLTAEAIALAAIAALAAVVGMAIPVLASSGPIASMRRSVGRQLDRTAAQRAGLDLAFVAFAAVLLWELRVNGAPISESFRGSVGIDPLLVAAPAIGLAAGAVLTMRVVPTLAALLERLVAGRPGVVAPLAARSIARRSSRYSRSALLLVVAVAIAFLAATYERTWRQSQVDQVGVAIPTDLIAAPLGTVGPAASLGGAAAAGSAAVARAAYEATEGVAQAAPIAEQRFDLRRAGGRGTLLAFSPELASGTVDLRADLATRPARDLYEAMVAARPAIGTIALPGRPTRLRLTVESDLAADATSAPATVDPLVGPIPLTASVVLRDAAGLLDRVTAPAALTGDGQVELSLTPPPAPAVDPAAAPADGPPKTRDWPLEVLAVELRGRIPAGTLATGSARLTGLEVAEGTTTEGAWAAVDPTTAAPSWTYAQVALERLSSATTATIDGPAMTAALDPARSPFGLDELTLTIGPRELLEAGSAAVPALADARLRALAAVGPDGRLDVTQGFADTLPLAAVGAIELAPTLDATEPGAIVDLPTLQLRGYMRDGSILPADGWWLSLAPGADAAAVRQALAEGHRPLEVTADRAAVLAERTNDPFQAAVDSVLAVVAGAALLFAAVGLAISLWYTVSSRQGEFAVSRALGLGRRQLLAWLAIESAFLIAVGVIGGVLVGLALAWVVMPTITLTTEGRPPVPPPVVAMAWDLVVTLAVLGLAAFGLSVVAARRTVASVRVAAALRVAEADR